MPDRKNIYTPAMAEQAMKIWIRSSIALMDVRSIIVERNKPLDQYMLPASTFIYIHGELASIVLNKEPYHISHYGLCHAGKGTMLSIIPNHAEVQVFMVLYRARTSPFYLRHRRRLLESFNPFLETYGFVPMNPLFFLEKFRTMVESWNKRESIAQFHTKTLLYQVVHQVHMELRQGETRYFEPDYVEWVKAYLDEHFAEPISLQSLANQVPLSRSLLGRLFRKRENSSLQEYLIKKRLHAAQVYLEQTEASIQEIAYGCGFLDEINMIRMFKKYIYLTPGEYRRKSIAKCTKNVIDNDYQHLYNEEGLDRLAKNQKDGELAMFGYTKKKEMLFALAISAMLLLSACTSTTSTNNGGTTNESAQRQQSEQTISAENNIQAVSTTRTVTTVKGDVEVPNEIKSVAVHTWAGDLLALGVTPSISNDAELGATKEALLGTQMSVFDDPEEIMAVEPDLIITRTEEHYDKLKSIATTVHVPYDTPLEDRMKLFGQIFGMEQAAQEALESFQNKVEKYVQDFKDAGIYGKTITIMFYDDNAPYIYGDNFGFGGQILYELLGFKLPEIIQTDIVDAGEGFRQLSWEATPQYLESDYLQVGNGDAALLSKASNNTIWNNVPAVKNNHLVFYSYDYDRKSLYVMDKVLDFYYEQFMSLVEK